MGGGGREEFCLVTADLAVQTSRSVDVPHDITAVDFALRMITGAACTQRPWN